MHGTLPVIIKDICSDSEWYEIKSSVVALRSQKQIASSVRSTSQAKIVRCRYDDWTFFISAVNLLRFSRILSCQKVPKSDFDTMLVFDFFSSITSVLLSDVPLTIQRMSMSVFPYMITLSVTWIDILAQAAIEKNENCHT